MSWYRDPQLFLQYHNSRFYIRRITNPLSVGTDLPVNDAGGTIGFYNFSEHFFLGNNKESDYDAFLSYLKTKPQFTNTNSEGLVVSYLGNSFYSVAREPPNSPFSKLPTLLEAQQEQQRNEKVQALEKKVSDLETILKDKDADINTTKKEVSDLKERLKQQKEDTKALEKKISELTSKLEESCGGGDGSADEEQWMSDFTVPSTWVSFDDLDVQTFPKDNHLNISKVIGAPKFADQDHTTNVQSKRFYRGVYPIVIVNVAELVPNQDDARFDPEIWSLYRNEGTSYAARKPFESEMLDARKTTGSQ